MHAQELIFFVPEDTAANYVFLSLFASGWKMNQWRILGL